MKNKKESTDKTEKTWIIELRIPAGQVAMHFDNESLARQEFEKIRVAGVYGGHWIQTLTFKDE